jgi:hypothetical protein
VDCYGVSVSDPTTRPATHWDVSVLESITPDAQGQQQRWALHVGRSFTDVAGASPFYRFVEALLHHSVTSGCTGTQFCPAAATTREQMAVFVLAAKEGAGWTPPACVPPHLFSDVPENSPFCRWIEELARRGVVSGCGGGAYCPGAPVSREQMAVFVLKTLEPTLAPPPCSPPNLFADVPETSPFCAWIEELANRGVVGGCGGGNYCPSAAVTREQMAIFVLRTLDPALDPPPCGTPLFNDVPASSPFCKWIEELARRGVVGGCGMGNYCPTGTVTREQMGVFLSLTFGLALYGP